jgi:hypothetical protein
MGIPRIHSRDKKGKAPAELQAIAKTARLEPRPPKYVAYCPLAFSTHRSTPSKT